MLFFWKANMTIITLQKSPPRCYGLCQHMEKNIRLSSRGKKVPTLVGIAINIFLFENKLKLVLVASFLTLENASAI